MRRIGAFPTGGRGGRGVNDPLKAGSSLTLTSGHSLLLAVNAGSGDISVFRVLRNGLALTSVTPSGGGDPVSIAGHGNLVHVVSTPAATTRRPVSRSKPRERSSR